MTRVHTGSAVTGRWLAPPSDGPLADAATHMEVQAFLALEAEALDGRAFDRWEELVDDAFTYQVPVPVVRDNPSGPPYDPGSLLMDEDKRSIVEIWFQRLAAGVYEVAWGDHPPVRFRHFISNLRVRHTGEPGVLLARSNVRLLMVRQATQPAELTAERFDHVRREGGGWRLLRRFAVLDSAVLAAPQLRVLL